MSDRFPAVTAKQVIRQTGSSHAIYKHPQTGRRTVVPMHAQVIVKRRTLKSILQDAGLDVQQFKAIL